LCDQQNVILWEANALQQLRSDRQALVSEELASSSAGDTKHVEQEANCALHRCAVKDGGHLVCGLVQVDYGLPQRGINRAAER
jgi:hypothetical protein